MINTFFKRYPYSALEGCACSSGCATSSSAKALEKVSILKHKAEKTINNIPNFILILLVKINLSRKTRKGPFCLIQVTAFRRNKSRNRLSHTYRQPLQN